MNTRRRNKKEMRLEDSYHIIFNLKSVETNLSPAFKSQDFQENVRKGRPKSVMHNIQDLMSSKLPSISGEMDGQVSPPWDQVLIQDLISSEYIQGSKSDLYFNGITIQDIIQSINHGPSQIAASKVKSQLHEPSIPQVDLGEVEPVTMTTPTQVHDISRDDPIDSPGVIPVHETNDEPVIDKVAEPMDGPIEGPILEPVQEPIFQHTLKPSFEPVLDIAHVTFQKTVAPVNVMKTSTKIYTNETFINPTIRNKVARYKTQRMYSKGYHRSTSKKNIRNLHSNLISDQNTKLLSPKMALHLDGGTHVSTRVDCPIPHIKPASNLTSNLGKRIRTVQDKLIEMSRCFRSNKSEPTIPYRKESMVTNRSSVSYFHSHLDVDSTSETSLPYSHMAGAKIFSSCDVSCVRFNLPPLHCTLPIGKVTSVIHEENKCSVGAVEEDKNIKIKSEGSRKEAKMITDDSKGPVMVNMANCQNDKSNRTRSRGYRVPLGCPGGRKVFDDLKLMESRLHKPPNDVYSGSPDTTTDLHRGFKCTQVTNGISPSPAQMSYYPVYPTRCRHGYRAGHIKTRHLDSFINEVPSNVVMELHRNPL